MPTLLIIDDDAGLRDALAETAEDQGYRVLQAEEGEAGLRLLAQETVDAVMEYAGKIGKTVIVVA